MRHAMGMASQKVIVMFALVAATLFSAAFLLAIGTMAWMFTAYRDKMVAALLFRPIPPTPTIYHVRIRRPRVTHGLRKVGRPLPTAGPTAGIVAA
jgi:hypothetical protein